MAAMGLGSWGRAPFPAEQGGRGGEWGWGLPEAHFDLDSEEGSRRSGQEGLQGLCNPVASIIIGLVSKNSPVDLHDKGF